MPDSGPKRTDRERQRDKEKRVARQLGTHAYELKHSGVPLWALEWVRRAWA